MSNFLPARLYRMRKIIKQEQERKEHETTLDTQKQQAYQKACDKMLDFYKQHENRFMEYFSEMREPSERKTLIKEIYSALNYTAPTAFPGAPTNNTITLYRGLTAANVQDIQNYTQDFINGEVVFGKKAQLHGTGIYMTTNADVAMKYATYSDSNGVLLQCETLDNIKMASSEQLTADKEAVLALMISQNQDDRNILMYSNFLSDNGVFAAIAGYDAINIPEKDYMLILNRGSIVVDDIVYYKDGQQYSQTEFEEQFLQSTNEINEIERQ